MREQHANPPVKPLKRGWQMRDQMGLLSLPNTACSKSSSDYLRTRLFAVASSPRSDDARMDLKGADAKPMPQTVKG
jgi:hypothetical protein